MASVGLGLQFARMYNPGGTNMSSMDWFRYWEADIVGTVVYPKGIKMVNTPTFILKH
jgi:hypothetical protein